MHPHMPFNARVEGQVSKCLGDTRLHLAQDRLLRDSLFILSRCFLEPQGQVGRAGGQGRWEGQVLLFALSIGKLRLRRADRWYFPSLYVREKNKRRGLLASGLEVLACAEVGLCCFLSDPWSDRAEILMKPCFRCLV